MGIFYEARFSCASDEIAQRIIKMANKQIKGIYAYIKEREVLYLVTVRKIFKKEHRILFFYHLTCELIFPF